MARTKKRALWWQLEGTYGVNPNGAGDGTGLVGVPATMIGDRKPMKAQLVTNYMTGRNFDTPNIPGPDGGEFEVEVPAIGLSAAAGVAVAPPTADWLDILLEHVHGGVSVRNGVAVASALAGSMTIATDFFSINDLVAVHRAAVPAAGPRSQWALLTSDGGTGAYNVSPAWVDVPTSASIAYGARVFRPDDDGGATLMCVYRDDDDDYTLNGCRAVALSVGYDDAGQIVKYKIRIAYDSATIEDLANLPAVVSAPAVTPVRSLLSGIWFNGTLYESAKASFDYGIVAAELRSSYRSNGRAGHESIRFAPKLTLSPIGENAVEQLQRNATVGPLVAQFGAGVLGGGVLNTLAIGAAGAQVVQTANEDDNGRRRTAVTIEIKDIVFATGTTPAIFFQTVRS